MPHHATPNWQQVFAHAPERLFRAIARHNIGPLSGGGYLHWEKLRHKKPPGRLATEQLWAAVKAARYQLRHELPLRDVAGNPFHYCPVAPIHEALHNIDARATGRIGMPDPVATERQRDRYLVSSLIEEAITSSQLEGAATTRLVAADMLRSGRRPRNHDEQMIFNNFRGMQQIREWRGREITPERVLALHRRMVEDTLENPRDAGRLQAPGDTRVAVHDHQTGKQLHQPPPAEELPERLARMCQFANRSLGGEDFLHPVIHAIVLHFWLAWDHPFVDGNGRTARALFYWKMLNCDYWLFEFISISTILRKAPGQYKRAFLETESDENDLTYFILHQLGVIAESLTELESYLERKSEEIRNVEQVLRTDTGYNHRQLALLAHALRNPRAEYTIRSHQRSHGVAYATARSDLLELSDHGLLDQSPSGSRPIRFYAPPDLAKRVDRD